MVELQVYNKTKQKSRQPAAECLPSTPFLMGLSAPSMGGKTVLWTNAVMNPALWHTASGEPCFDEVHVWTGSAREDVALAPFKKWAEDVLHMDPEKNPAVHDWNPDEMRGIIEKQRKAVRKARREGKRVPQQ